MKIIVTAIALAFAFPAAAQTTPAQHQDHAQHQPAQHNQQGQHQQGQPGQHQPGPHQGHGEGCCADRNNNGRMDCCEQADGAQQRDCCEQHREQAGGHQGH